MVVGQDVRRFWFGDPRFTWQCCSSFSANAICTFTVATCSAVACNLVSPPRRLPSRGARGGVDAGKPEDGAVDESVVDANIISGDPVVGLHPGQDQCTVVRTVVSANIWQQTQLQPTASLNCPWKQAAFIVPPRRANMIHIIRRLAENDSTPQSGRWRPDNTVRQREHPLPCRVCAAVACFFCTHRRYERHARKHCEPTPATDSRPRLDPLCVQKRS